MSYPKIKTASFTNFGGINSKTSPYILGQNEFTNLINVDFQMPGSLTKRWGSTMYVGTTLSTKIVGVYEYQTTAGFSQIIAVGQSTVYAATGFSLTPMYNYFGFTTTFGGTDFSGFVGTSFGTGYTFYLGGTFWYDFENYANYLWGVNGQDIWKYDGSSFYFFSYGNPPGAFATYVLNSSGVSPDVGGMTGYYFYCYGNVNGRGYYGPITSLDPTEQCIPNGATQVEIDFYSTYFGITYGFEMGYGTTAIAIYRAGPYDDANLPENQKTFFRIGLVPLGATSFIDHNIPQGATLAPTSISMVGELYNNNLFGAADLFGTKPQFFKPRYIELFNNQMFFGGFYANALNTVTANPMPNPSLVWFSDIGDPESIQPESNFEVKTNDGDVLRGMKSYLSSLLLFKTNSFHRLSGQDPQNFALTEISTQYGCVSNRAICVATNTCYFLDRKGVIAFNGANIDIISNKIDPVFARMNYNASLDQAAMTYDKVRNQIIVEIPIDDSLVNNFTVVYDTIVQAWTTYDGIKAASSSIIRGSLPNFSYIYGNYDGALQYNGPSYFSDNGVAYTALIKTRFFNEIDPATTKQWRRIFFNMDQESGSTVTVNLIPNYGTSNAITRSFVQSPYLSRIDFGIPSTALSFELSMYSPVDSLRLHGFTMEYRFQRNVQDIEK